MTKTDDLRLLAESLHAIFLGKPISSQHVDECVAKIYENRAYLNEYAQNLIENTDRKRNIEENNHRPLLPDIPFNKLICLILVFGLRQCYIDYVVEGYLIAQVRIQEALQLFIAIDNQKQVSPRLCRGTPKV